MAENYLSDRPGYGRTFSSAMWIIALIASIQIVVLGFGALRRGPAPKEVERVSLTEESPLANPVPALPALPVLPAIKETVPLPPVATALVTEAPRDIESPPTGRSLNPQSFIPPAIIPTPSLTGPAAESGSQSLSAILVEAARAHVLAGEPILERLMTTGAELRASGNMQGALQAFREVETALADHPRILSELAATLSQMGLSEKANAYWERVEGLGPVQGGAYFSLAGQQLRGELPPAAASTSKLMKIAEVKVEENARTGEGQKVTLRVVVDADPKARPIGDDLTLLVYFYDLVADGEVKASTADTSYLYPSKPYDWQGDGTEEIVVNYNQPVFTEEQKRELGVRSYYGYAIELYYRDQIQDKVVMPEVISKLKIDPGEMETAPSETFLGPENALFPSPAFR